MNKIIQLGNLRKDTKNFANPQSREPKVLIQLDMKGKRVND